MLGAQGKASWGVGEQDVLQVSGLCWRRQRRSPSLKSLAPSPGLGAQESHTWKLHSFTSQIQKAPLVLYGTAHCLVQFMRFREFSVLPPPWTRRKLQVQIPLPSYAGVEPKPPNQPLGRVEGISPSAGSPGLHTLPGKSSWERKQGREERAVEGEQQVRVSHMGSLKNFNI